MILRYNDSAKRLQNDFLSKLIALINVKQ
jgi:hypothetical protein